MERSSGILVYRKCFEWEFLLAFPGGPYYSIKKDKNRWTIPKGKIEKNEDLLTTAIREFKEEVGIDLINDKNNIKPLGEIKYNRGKRIFIYTLKKDLDISNMYSNKSHMEWPKNSGKKLEFNEIDYYKYMTIKECRKKCHLKQLELIEKLYKNLEN